MKEIISLLFPAAFGTLIYLRNCSKNDISESVLIYMINNVLTNVLCLFIDYYIFRIEDYVFTNIFTIKYLLLAIMISILVGVLMTLINKKVALEIEVVKVEKGREKPKK